MERKETRNDRPSSCRAEAYLGGHGRKRMVLSTTESTPAAWYSCTMCTMGSLATQPGGATCAPTVCGLRKDDILGEDDHVTESAIGLTGAARAPHGRPAGRAKTPEVVKGA